MVKVAVYSLSSCQGCITTIVSELGRLLSRLPEIVEITYFKDAKELYPEHVEHVDIAFVEGAVVTEENLKLLKAIREKCRILVALGNCASLGNMAYVARREFGESIVKSAPIKYVDPAPLKKYVKVDFELRGCPVTPTEFLEAISKLARGVIPWPTDEHVCANCKFKGNACFLKRGIVCLGPITYGGCGAPCPSSGVPCYGCRGLALDVDIKAYRSLIEELGLSWEAVVRKAKMFMGVDLEKLLEEGGSGEEGRG